MDCDSLRSPSEENSRIRNCGRRTDFDSTCDENRNYRIQDGGFVHRSDLRIEDLKISHCFGTPWHAGKIPENRFWGMLVEENMMSSNHHRNHVYDR
jgi:hypothetical protein